MENGQVVMGDLPKWKKRRKSGCVVIGDRPRMGEGLKAHSK